MLMTVPETGMPETIQVVLEDRRWLEFDLEALAMRAFPAVLSETGLNDDTFEIVLLGCDDTRIRALNADFRAQDKPTNVLSWPETDLGADQPGDHPRRPDSGDPMLGDIAISYETCVAEAADAVLSPADHITHLLVHGCLHLLGYDHVYEKDAEIMEGLEVSILAKLGISDPY